MRLIPRNLTSLISGYAGKLVTMRNEIRTERFLRSLPEEIRRDIGFPSAFDRHQR